MAGGGARQRREARLTRLAVLVPMLLAAAPAAAQRDPHRPTAEERAWLERCVARVEADFPDRAFSRCARRLTRACLGHEEAEVPRLRQPAGRNSHPRSCAPIEATLWDELLNRWYREAQEAMRPEAAEALRRAQRAWIAFRDLACEVEAEMAPSFYGLDLAADCRLARVAERALELRRLADLAREVR